MANPVSRSIEFLATPRAGENRHKFTSFSPLEGRVLKRSILRGGDPAKAWEEMQTFITEHQQDPALVAHASDILVNLKAAFPGQRNYGSIEAIAQRQQVKLRIKELKSVIEVLTEMTLDDGTSDPVRARCVLQTRQAAIDLEGLRQFQKVLGGDEARLHQNTLWGREAAQRLGIDLGNPEVSIWGDEFLKILQTPEFIPTPGAILIKTDPAQIEKDLRRGIRLNGQEIFSEEDFLRGVFDHARGRGVVLHAAELDTIKGFSQQGFMDSVSHWFTTQSLAAWQEVLPGREEFFDLKVDKPVTIKGHGTPSYTVDIIDNENYTIEANQTYRVVNADGEVVLSFEGTQVVEKKDGALSEYMTWKTLSQQDVESAREKFNDPDQWAVGEFLIG